MSYGYADLRRRIAESHGEVDQPPTQHEVPSEISEILAADPELKPAAAATQKAAPAPSPSPAPSKRTRGTSPFPQVKISRVTYDALKVVASLSGKTVQQMLERFVREGVDGFRNLTVDQILSR